MTALSVSKCGSHKCSSVFDSVDTVCSNSAGVLHPTGVNFTQVKKLILNLSVAMLNELKSKHTQTKRQTYNCTEPMFFQGSAGEQVYIWSI